MWGLKKDYIKPYNIDNYPFNSFSLAKKIKGGEQKSLIFVGGICKEAGKPCKTVLLIVCYYFLTRFEKSKIFQRPPYAVGGVNRLC